MPPLNPVPIDAVPYLDTSDLRGRIVLLMPFWDGKEWHVWVPTDGGFLPMRPVDVGHADYVAVSSARDDDLFIPFIDLMWQRATWPEIIPRVSAIADDFHNFFSSVAKIRFLHRKRSSLRALEVDGFVSTELEYLAMLARSVLDLAHEVVSRIWHTYTKLLDANGEQRRRATQLPRSFADMVLQQGAGSRSPDELVEKYALPPALAAAYIRQYPFFSKLRPLRDGIVHGLTRPPGVCLTPRGFAVERTNPNFEGIALWRESDVYSERLVSLLPWIAQVVFRTVGACNDIMHSFAAEVELLPELAPGYRVYIRTPHSRVVTELSSTARGVMSWWPDEDETPQHEVVADA